jgi:hypothetical protein
VYLLSLDVTAVSRELFSTNRAGEIFGFEVGHGDGPTEAEINQRWQELTAAAERQFQDPQERTREIWRLGEVASALLTAVRAQAAVQPGVDRSALRLRWDQDEQPLGPVVPPPPAAPPAPPQALTPPMPQQSWGPPPQSGRGQMPPRQSPSPQAPRASGHVGARKAGRDALQMSKKFALWPFRSSFVKRLPSVPRWMIRLSWLMMILLILQTFYFGITGRYLYGDKLPRPVPPTATTHYQSPRQGPAYKPSTTGKYRPCIQVSSKPGEEGKCIKWGPAQK